MILLLTNTIKSSNKKDLKQFELTCGVFNKTCLIAGGVCTGEKPNKGQICICSLNYTTFPEDSLQMCNYVKFYQKTALIYEAVFSFGVGHYYTNNYLFAALKTTFFSIGYILMFSIRVFSKESDNYNIGIVNLSAASSCFIFAMIAWQITDVYNYAMNKYLDGNQITLVPWSDPRTD